MSKWSDPKQTKRLDNGVKACQRADGHIDRSFSIRERFRKEEINGRDSDFLTKKVWIEWTKSNEPHEEAGDNEWYRNAVDERRMREGEDKFLIENSRKLKKRSVIVLYYDGKNDHHFWVRHPLHPRDWKMVETKVFFQKLREINNQK